MVTQRIQRFYSFVDERTARPSDNGLLHCNALRVTYLVACLLLVSINSRADNFMQNADNYTCMLMGLDKIKFELPTQYDGSFNEGITEGHVYIYIDGGSRQTLFDWKCTEYNELDKKKNIQAFQNGDFFLSGKAKDISKNNFTMSDNVISYNLDHDNSNSNHYTTTVEWTVPRELRGHRMKFVVYAKIDDIFSSWKVDDHNMGTIDMPEAGQATVTLNDPMLSVTRDHVNEVMLSYSFVVNKIFWANLHYTDVVTGQQYTQALPTGTKVGFTYIPADRPWKDIYIEARVTDAQTKSDDERYRINIESDHQASSMLHNPKNLKAEFTTEGKAVLTWSVDDPELADISEGDFFEIQRNSSGSTNSSDSNWRTISMDSEFKLGKEKYTYTDESLLEQYEGKPVAYRIRRSVTSMWQWASADAYQIYQVPWLFKLPVLTNATVHRTDTWNDEKRIVEFAFEKKNSSFDDDGNFVVRTNEDFTRLNELVAKGEASYQKTFVCLSDRDMWVSLAQLLETGADVQKIILVSDIDLSGCEEMLGSIHKSFSGIFDGNGHSITVDYNTTDDYTAPFSYVGNVTIKNLTVEGNIRTNNKFAGGLIGYVYGNVNIEKVNVAATIQLDTDGDASSGGLIGYMHQTSNVDIKNSIFMGSIVGIKSHSNGGFVGVALWNTKLTLDNCLFAPKRIATLSNGCNTFARMDSNSQHTVTNSYYTQIYGTSASVDGKQCMAINNSEDWKTFVQIVKEVKGAEVNAVLTADISISNAVGSLDNVAWHGTFDGNGHQLNVSINNLNAEFNAPFARVNNVTIRNLYVTGSVYGSIHSSGLIGHAINSSNTIENVRVSATIYAYGTHAGGFIGHGGSGSSTLTNCLFDGSILSSSSKGQYAGVFIGWEDGTTKSVVSKCLENGSYAGFAHVGMNYHTSNNGGVAWCTPNCYSYHNWGETEKAISLSTSEVVNKLGSSVWTVENNKVVPLMARMDIVEAFGGTPAIGWTGTALAQALGEDNWQASNDVAYPIMPASQLFNYAFWDKRAKLQLNINMHGENGTTTRVVDLSNNEAVINNEPFTQELTRNCVEYTFDLVLRRGSSPLTISGTSDDTLMVAVVKTDQGDLANYRYMNQTHITEFLPKTKQSSVELTWKTSGGESDFFRLLRRKHTTDANAEWTDTLATDLMQQFYEDKTVQVQQSYDYLVESILQCEGIHIENMACYGASCEPTGRVSGYVRMADGTAMAGVMVECSPNGTIPGADALYTTYTDETGFFEFNNLPYQIDGNGNSNGIYNIHIPTKSGSGSYTSPNEGGVVNFTQNTNWTQNFNFYMDTYFIYSGNVFYRDTSIPVPGVQFMLDGQVMHDASQHPIETDTQGAFKLSIPAGSHKVQAVKEGHYFANRGFLINRDAPEDSTIYNFNKNVPEAVIWDSTTVVLRGRVVGGDVQGSMPLGKNMSVNNLGDSLKIVMQLEGDNTSYLIRKQDDETVRSDSYDVSFGPDNKNKSHIDVTRHTLTIRPDAATGEYQVELHPAKYKVIEVSAQGYPTLFQQGKVGETVDLSFNKNGDICEYNRIYHSIPTVDVTQFNPSGEKYFGVKSLTSNDNIGNTANVKLWFTKKLSETDSVGIYTFGYPVFMAGSPYGFMLQACEKYYWNNDVTKRVDIVRLDQRGKISISNAMTTDSKTAVWSCDLDSAGGCTYIFTPNDPTFVLDNAKALKTIDINLLYDGTYYDVLPFEGNKPLQGYVMAQKPVSNGRRVVVAGTPKLWDILRDPPGGGSTSYIEEGSKLGFGYSLNMSGQAGFSVKSSTGSGSNIYHGFVAAPAGEGETAGTLDFARTEKGADLQVITNFGGAWTWNYNMDITERIQTRSGSKWVGPKADLFIGTTENIIFQDAMAVRAIPDSMYQIVKCHEGGLYTTKNGISVNVPVGTTKVLAQGEDDTGSPIYLVRDEVLMASPAVKSTFIHSQEYIEKELLPDLMKMRNSLILPKGYDRQKAQALANARGYATYISTVDEDSKDFGLEYEIFRPDKETTGDSIAALNNEMVAWIEFLAKNEEEKLSVMSRDLVKRYDFDGGSASIQYSESFSTATTSACYLHFPLWPGNNNLFAEGGILGTWFSSLLDKLVMKGGMVHTQENYTSEDENGEVNGVEMEVLNTSWKCEWRPVLGLNLSDKFNSSESYSKKVGFTLAAAAKSSLTVDVYRTATEFTYNKDANHFYQLTSEMLDKLRYGSLVTPTSLTYSDYDNTQVYSNFVFRTMGGTTCQPYEEERVSKWYQPGTVMDVATTPIDKPHIWIDEPEVAGVPFDEPARFQLHFANETDFPDQASMLFNYYIMANSNPNGAKICVDGKPLGPGGENIVLYPAFSNGEHQVFTKEITVYPSKAFDYEDLTICLYDPEDAGRVFSQKFSAHFIPTAGKVKVTVPSDKWVMNTESPYDADRKAFYMPVRIEGFDVNYPNFDHIELQYKLSTQGDKDWVSVCSYYADEDLRAKASGVTDDIPTTGIIVASFYGEGDPVEQYYDLRAAVYCRHAGGYLTGYSDVLTGIKDTRPPVAFGNPEPTNGVLDIGEDIKITFSEPIAANYLRNINNFEVLGQVKSNAISTSTCLTFTQGAVATTQASRNFSGKSFTVDVMLNPVNNNRAMTVFSQGSELKGISFGLTPDRHLMANVNGKTVTSDSVVEFTGMLQQVAWSLDQSENDMTINFFDGSTLIGSKQITGKYEGASPMLLGNNVQDFDEYYEGDMMEMRLWNRAMSSVEIDVHRNMRLTGYENGLLNYYPMNEGKDNYAYDKAPSAMDLMLVGTTWKRPSGISVAFKGDKGLVLKPEKFTRTTQHDYTLMFWFRSNDGMGTLFSNGTALDGQENQLNIGLEGSSLYVRSAGFEVMSDKFLVNGEWHHFAMTVSRSQNVVNVYVDKNLLMSFAAQNLSGIQGDHIALGATYTNKTTPTQVFKGHIDEVAMFASALPQNLLSDFSTLAPKGTMAALMAYLDFGHSEKMDDNTLHLEPNGISLKRYVDSQGNVLARLDTLVANSEVSSMADRNIYAPMTNSAQLENVNYSFVAYDNQLLINITEPDFMIEKTNIYLTVKEVPDLQGNLMPSPITMDIFVYRNPLRWNVKSISQEVQYHQGAEFYATVRNLSGMSQFFQLDDLPLWISASQTSGTIDPLGEQLIKFTVNDYINIGTYTEQITLTCENGMAEPLPVTLKVRDNEPEWAVGDRLRQINQTMLMVAQVKIDNIIASSTEDILAVFNDQEQTLGVAHIEIDNRANAGEALAYLTIYGYSNADGSSPRLHFRFFHASNGTIYSVQPEDGSFFLFERDALVGTNADPVVLANNIDYVQSIQLKKGWNWVTINVLPVVETVGEFFNAMSKWEPGDMITSINGSSVQKFNCRKSRTSTLGYAWDNANETIYINPSQMYNIYSMSDKTIYLEGVLPYNAIHVANGWNRIGFLSNINLPIAQAMADYIDHASVGDILKSQDAFAIVSSIDNGVVTWKGSLQYLDRDKGYMLKRIATDSVEFYYPLYFDQSRYDGLRKHAMPTSHVATATTMNMVARIIDFDIQADDRLLVYRGAQRMAEAIADDEQLYYLSIGSDDTSNATFTLALERDGEIIATTPTNITYQANRLIGTPDEPASVRFNSLQLMPHDGQWYTIQGISVGTTKPTTTGVYIYNGKAIMIK